jgi:predicted lipase
LGGALAILTAFRLAHEFAFRSLQCYTFGAPRPGNMVFKHEYNVAVPETWNVINGKDIVPYAAKVSLSVCLSVCQP